ncbi:hypothetical protein [Polaromonas sp. CF318]|nr:hypothetical protein [Polaromonas sp. CF318]
MTITQAQEITTMKLMAGLLTGMAAGLLTAWRVHADPRNIDLLHAFLTVLVCAAGLFLVSMALPDSIAQVLQEFMAWCLAGTIAALGLLATVKVLEGLLDN